MGNDRYQGAGDGDVRAHRKEIPAAYRDQILAALAHYPELGNTYIRFVTVDRQEHPLMADLALGSVLTRSGGRKYVVRISEEADAPLHRALLRHLPREAGIAAVAHELSHILQMENCGRLRAVRMAAQGHQRERERAADESVIEHGLGFELYTLALYMSSVKGLAEQYRDPDVNRLNPGEILEALPPDQLHQVHRH